MRLRIISQNCTLLLCPRPGIDAVLFSYETPVAAKMSDGSFIVTEQKYSHTTSKHVSRWLAEFPGILAQTSVPQKTLDNLPE